MTKQHQKNNKQHKGAISNTMEYHMKEHQPNIHGGITNNMMEEQLATLSNNHEQHDGTSMSNVKKHQPATQ